jgi:hypothetical protein
MMKIRVQLQKGRLYFTKNSISSACIHTIALTNKDDFSRVEKLNSTDAIVKRTEYLCGL